ncbi:MAG: MBL fold metallo-hydrolase [Nitrososphaerales archaeon]
MTSLTFYGGINEIGGNKILLEDRDTKVFLDFGKSFNKYSKYFQDYLKPRASNGIADFIEMGLIPRRDGLYRDDLLQMGGMKGSEVDIDAVILTHAHSDHCSHISFLHEDIPLYMGETAHLILQALEERSSRDIESEILTFNRRPTGKNSQLIQRKVHTFRTGDKLKIGSVEVEPVHVDHSIPGAYGLLVHTSEGTIAYSGDLRLQGTRPQMTQEFVNKVEQSKPEALIMEGTRLAEEKGYESEQKVRNECNEVVKKSDKFVVADFSFKDVDRLRTFYTIAKENERKFAVLLRDAFLLKWLNKDPELQVPSYDDENIIIHLPRRGSGTYIDHDYGKRERDFLNLNNVWTAEQLKQNQNKVVCAMTFFQFDELIDIKPEPYSIMLYSTSEPHTEEQQFDYQRLMAWADRFDFRIFQSHCSGHAYSGDLMTIVKQINPKHLFPVHTEYPEMFKRATQNITIVKEKKSYVL